MSLYRFGKREYLEDFLNGNLSFAIASSYSDITLTVAQQDNEQARTLTPDLKRNVFIINGSPIRALKEVKITHTARDAERDRLNYYLMSFTSIHDERFYKEFGSDACIEIFNEIEFQRRLDAALKAIDWKGLLRGVVYFDPQKLLDITSNEDILFSKSDQYDWQQEFRIVVFPASKNDLKESRKNISVGDLSDIAKFVKINDR